MGHTLYTGYIGGKMSLDDMVLREEIAREIESLSLGEDNAQLNALGMRMLAAQVARGKDNQITTMFERQEDFE
jgi:hypothetical protein